MKNATPKYYNERANKNSQKYRSTHIRQIKFDLSIQYDADILAYLDALPNRTGYIKDLIRADIAARANSKKEEPTMKEAVSINQFVQDLFDACDVTPEEMDIDTARNDLEMFRRQEDWEIPADITPEEFMAEWNELVRAQNQDAATVRYQVDYTDPDTGATSPIDTISARAGYTAVDYIRDCDANADSDLCEMLHRGSVTLQKLD